MSADGAERAAPAVLLAGELTRLPPAVTELQQRLGALPLHLVGLEVPPAFEWPEDADVFRRLPLLPRAAWVDIEALAPACGDGTEAQDLLGVLDAAVHCGLRLLVLQGRAFTGGPGPDHAEGKPVEYSRYAAEMASRLEALPLAAEQAGIVLALAVPEAGMLHHPPEVRERIDRINSPRVGVALDADMAARTLLAPASPARGAALDRAVASWVQELGHRVRAVVVTAGAGEWGEDHVPWARTLSLAGRLADLEAVIVRGRPERALRWIARWREQGLLMPKAEPVAAPPPAASGQPYVENSRRREDHADDPVDGE